METEEYDLRKAELTELQGRIHTLLVDLLPVRLEDPEWYLTGVDVGLDSLKRFYEASRLVYKGFHDLTLGAQKVENLNFVYERLIEFQRALSTQMRSQIFLEHKDRFESLLRDFEESDKSAGFKGERLTIIEQIAKDITNATNSSKSHENVLAVLTEIRDMGFFRRKFKDAKIESLLQDYGLLLEGYKWTDPKGFRDKAGIKHKIRRVQDEIKRIRRRLVEIRDQMYKGRKDQISDPDHPEVDLHPKKIIPFLKDTSKEGLAYLHRAYTIYEHALEKEEGGLALLGRAKELALQIDEIEWKKRNLDEFKTHRKGSFVPS